MTTPLSAAVALLAVPGVMLLGIAVGLAAVLYDA